MSEGPKVVTESPSKVTQHSNALSRSSAKISASSLQDRGSPNIHLTIPPMKPHRPVTSPAISCDGTSGSGRVQSKHSPQRLTRMSSSTAMLLGISVFFLCTTAPMAIYFLLDQKWIKLARTDNHTNAKVRLGYAITNILYYTNNVVNFFLYCLTGSKFRKALADWLKTQLAIFAECLRSKRQDRILSSRSSMLSTGGTRVSCKTFWSYYPTRMQIRNW